MSIILNVSKRIRREMVETLEDKTIERILLLMVFVQMPSMKKANIHAGTHIIRFLIKIFSDSLVKSFLIAIKFRID